MTGLVPKVQLRLQYDVQTWSLREVLLWVGRDPEHFLSPRSTDYGLRVRTRKKKDSRSARQERAAGIFILFYFILF